MHLLNVYSGAKVILFSHIFIDPSNARVIKSLKQNVMFLFTLKQ